MLIAQQLSYNHINKETLFNDLSFSIHKGVKVALIGQNGTGKSTLLKLIAGELNLSSGIIFNEFQPYFIPQLIGQFDHLTVKEVLKIDHKLDALKSIQAGDATEEALLALDDDWSIDERFEDALKRWHLRDIDPDQKMNMLSGGQKTRVLLAGITLHQPEFILLDEPSNHLDISGRSLLYEFIQQTSATILLVSHDRNLLNYVDMIFELDQRGITLYGGNYHFYSAQKEIETTAIEQSIRNKEKSLRKAREVAREATERQQKLDARGKNKQIKAGVARISMNTLRNKAEQSTSKLKGVHAEKTDHLMQDLLHLRTNQINVGKMKLAFEKSELHSGKILVSAHQLNHTYDKEWLWKNDLDFQIKSGDRMAIKGDNGSGKTTLIGMIIGANTPASGILERSNFSYVYIDQNYSAMNTPLSVYEQAQTFNDGTLMEHDIKIRLNRFLFSKEGWDKPCTALSGGEKMKLMLCCLNISNHAPDMIILDEPTNNLDIHSLEMLTSAINEYHGTLIVVSHDGIFAGAVGLDKEIVL